MQNKTTLLKYFRERGNEGLATLRGEIGSENYKNLAAGLNKTVVKALEAVTQVIISKADTEGWNKLEKLRALLTSTYGAQVAMIDLRNEVWQYEYMTLSRRMGEFWENFVRLPFSYPISEIVPFIPPLFSEVRSNLNEEVENYIQTLPLSGEQKKELLTYYEKVWSLVNSGEISLQLDLHLEIGGRKVNIDFKSGFGSNEKGNTNRLLMVATVYHNLSSNYDNVLLVRACEDLNNHYFKTLKRSGVWDAYCGNEAYSKMNQYTGFNLQEWIEENIDWKADLPPFTLSHLKNTNC
jgi:hypothetical protein